MFTHNIDPVLLSLGPFEVRYYGLFYVLAFIIGYFLLIHLAKKRQLDISKEDIQDFLLYGAICIVIGSRLAYVLFYNLFFFLENPLQIFAIWNGGLSFHGGLIGGVLFAIFFAKKKKIDIAHLGDLVVIPIALGLALGRLGNFTNGELPGRVTNVPWAVQFPGYEDPRHPSQIYASLKNLLNAGILWFLYDKKLPKGLLFVIFILVYAVLRFIVEFFREPDPQLGFIVWFLTMGQILSLVVFAIGIWLIFYVKKINKEEK